MLEFLRKHPVFLCFQAEYAKYKKNKKMKKIIVCLLVGLSFLLTSCGENPVEADIKAIHAINMKLESQFDIKRMFGAQETHERIKILKEISIASGEAERELSALNIRSENIKNIHAKIIDTYKRYKNACIEGAKFLEKNEQASEADADDQAAEAEYQANAQKIQKGFLDLNHDFEQVFREFQNIANENKIKLTRS